MINAGSEKLSFSRSLATQSRVIHALLMREILTRYGRHNIGFLWLFVEPMMFTLGVAALWTFAKMGHSDMPIIAFAITGYSSVLLWRNMPSRCMGAVEPNLGLMYHRNVRLIDIYLSRLVLEFCGATLSFIILSLWFITLGLIIPPDDVMRVIFGWIMIAWFGFSLALTVGALSEMTEVVDKIWHPITYILFPLSGTVYMVDWLPKEAQSFVLKLPMVHGVEILREGFFGSKVKAHYDIEYMVIICLIMTLFGLALSKNLSSKVASK